ncbi:MAG: ABC transporter substrate-binding protein [Nocardioides sp.]
MRRSRLVLPTSLLVALALTACGSNLDPSAVDRGLGAAPGSVLQQQAAVGNPGGPLIDAESGANPAPEGVPALPPDQAAGPGTPGAPAATSAPAPVEATAPGEPAPGDKRDDSGAAEAADCAGLENSTGITDSTITIGNASDISGPVPGLFESSRLATTAFVKYFNDSGATICGRKLALKSYDSRTDASADQQAYAAGCVETFAMVGSMSGFDSGGAATAEKCGIPDLRAIATTTARGDCATCYAVQPAGSGEFQNAVPDYIKRVTGGQHAAMLYLTAGAAAENGPNQAAAGTKRGLKYVYVAGVDTGEFNYVPFVQAMKDKGVTSVQFVAAQPMFVRLVKTMEQQQFEPELTLLDPTAYKTDFTGPGGNAAIDTVSFINFVPFEEAGSSAELSLYLNFLQQVRPGAEPDFFGVFAWSAARLFVEQATKLGGDLTRASLVASLRSVTGWTANDLHGPMRVGDKRPPECWRFVQWSGATWQAVDGRDYHCSGTTT